VLGGTPAEPLRVHDKALRSLLVGATVDGLARQWLTFDPSKARVLG
jgi:hypothetical protein